MRENEISVIEEASKRNAAEARNIAVEEAQYLLREREKSIKYVDTISVRLAELEQGAPGNKSYISEQGDRITIRSAIR